MTTCTPTKTHHCPCCGENVHVYPHQCANCAQHDNCQNCNYCTAHCRCNGHGPDSIAEAMRPNAPTTTNANGGMQSILPYRCDLLPFRALLAVSKVLKDGAERYAVDNWRKIPRSDHINHALAHICAAGAGDATDEHIAHAATRLLMAMETT